MTGSKVRVVDNRAPARVWINHSWSPGAAQVYVEEAAPNAEAIEYVRADLAHAAFDTLSDQLADAWERSDWSAINGIAAMASVARQGRHT